MKAVLTDTNKNELARYAKEFSKDRKVIEKVFFTDSKGYFAKVKCRLLLHYSYTSTEKSGNYGIFYFHNEIYRKEMSWYTRNSRRA